MEFNYLIIQSYKFKNAAKAAFYFVENNCLTAVFLLY